MNTGRALMVAVGALLTLGVPTSAQDRNSPPEAFRLIPAPTVLVTAPLRGASEGLFVGDSEITLGTLFQCNVVNVSKQPLSVHVVILDENGFVLASDTFPLNPARAKFLQALPQGDVAYCKISFEGSSDSVRGLLQQLYPLMTEFHTSLFHGAVAEAR